MDRDNSYDEDQTENKLHVAVEIEQATNTNTKVINSQKNNQADYRSL